MNITKEESIKKTMTKKGLELYTYDETFIYTFCHLYGFTGLWLKNLKDVSKFINRTEASVKMQFSNVNYMIGSRSGGVLSDYSELQEKVYNDIKEMGRFKALLKTKELIKHDEHERERLLKLKGVTNYRKA